MNFNSSSILYYFVCKKNVTIIKNECFFARNWQKKTQLIKSSLLSFQPKFFFLQFSWSFLYIEKIMDAGDNKNRHVLYVISYAEVSKILVDKYLSLQDSDLSSPVNSSCQIYTLEVSAE